MVQTNWLRVPLLSLGHQHEPGTSRRKRTQKNTPAAYPPHTEQTAVCLKKIKLNRVAMIEPGMKQWERNRQRRAKTTRSSAVQKKGLLDQGATRSPTLSPEAAGKLFHVAHPVAGDVEGFVQVDLWIAMLVVVILNALVVADIIRGVAIVVLDSCRLSLLS